MWDDAFIQYTTVFRSRVASARVVSSCNDGRQKHNAALERKICRFLFNKVEISKGSSNWLDVLNYLNQKGYLTQRPQRKKPYKGLRLEKRENEVALMEGDVECDKIEVNQVDAWLSDRRVPSTTGAPTEDNIEEVIESARDLGFCNTKNQNLRLADVFLQILLARKSSDDNPYLVEEMGDFYFYSIMKSDFFVIVPLLEHLKGRDTFSRDEIVEVFPSVIDRAIELCAVYFPRRDIMRDLKSFRRQVDETISNYDKSKSRGPGVLEHRVSSRLEKLLDVGFLSKSANRNAFQYISTPLLGDFLNRFAAHEASKRSFAELFSSYLDSKGYSNEIVTFAEIVDTYKKLAPRIGSISIEQLCVGFFTMERRANVRSFYKALFEQKGNKNVRFTGGRYNRNAEFVWIRH